MQPRSLRPRLDCLFHVTNRGLQATGWPSRQHIMVTFRITRKQSIAAKHLLDSSWYQDTKKPTGLTNAHYQIRAQALLSR